MLDFHLPITLYRYMSRALTIPFDAPSIGAVDKESCSHFNLLEAAQKRSLSAIGYCTYLEGKVSLYLLDQLLLRIGRKCILYTTVPKSKKRNSFTVKYLDCGNSTFYTFTECFIFTHNNAIAVLQHIQPLSVSCKDHSDIKTNCLHSVVHTIPITVTDDF